MTTPLVSSSSGHPGQHLTPSTVSDPFAETTKIKLIVASRHSCTTTGRKQRLEIWPDETLTDLGNTLAGSFAADDDFVPPAGAFYFQYYDSEEEDVVSIPRYTESQYRAADFRGKKLTVVPIPPPAEPNQPQVEPAAVDPQEAQSVLPTQAESNQPQVDPAAVEPQEAQSDAQTEEKPATAPPSSVNKKLTKKKQDKLTKKQKKQEKKRRQQEQEEKQQQEQEVKKQPHKEKHKKKHDKRRRLLDSDSDSVQVVGKAYGLPRNGRKGQHVVFNVDDWNLA